MYEQESISNANLSQNINDTNSQKPLPEPHFLDAEVIEHAKPAVPLSEVRKKRSWPLMLILLAALAGLTGGVLGSLILHAFRNSGAANQPRNQSSEQIAVASGALSSQTGEEHSAAASAQPAIAPSENDSQTPAASANNGASHESDTEALRKALNEWIAATNARDIERQMSFYNPTVNAFYLTRNVTASDVRAEKVRVIERANSVDIRAGQPVIRINPDGQTATMRFIKSYQIAANGQTRSGEVLQELRWQRVNGNWKIVSERDLKVLQ